MKKETTKIISDYIICDLSKLDRVINGAVGSQGQLTGGLGKDASEEAILAEYDKIGGLIRTQDGEKVEIGTFYDFTNRKPRTEIRIKIAKDVNKKGLKLNIEKVGDDDKKSKKKEKKLKFEDEE